MILWTSNRKRHHQLLRRLQNQPRRRLLSLPISRLLQLQNLFRLRLQSETERLEAPSEIVKAKREIARIMTILRLREIDRQRSVAAPTTPKSLTGKS